MKLGIVGLPNVGMLTHHSRDMRVLLATFEALDRYALARKRPLTLPLLREWLAEPTGKML